LARPVDLDNAQTEWNKSAMDNRGVVDSIFTFGAPIGESTFNFLREKIREWFSGPRNARAPMVLGNDAKFHRLSLTPAEMDFLESRRFGREEICGVFGVPLQLVAASEALTYNSFAQALRILYELTVLPVLDDMANSLTLFFQARGMLRDDERLGPDTSDVAALRKSHDEKATTAKTYYDMGIPVAQINDRLDLGFKEYDGWDQPWNGKLKALADRAQSLAATSHAGQDAGTRARFWRLIPFEQRSVADEQKRRDNLAEGRVKKAFDSLMAAQQKRVMAAVEEGHDISAAVLADHDEWLAAMNREAGAVALLMAGTVIVGERGRRPGMERRDAHDDAISSAIDAYLTTEAMMLRDLSHMEQTTIGAITSILTDALTEGRTTAEIQQSIQDIGVFGPERSLMLSRTLAGTAASVGQMAGAEVGGATRKTWQDSGFEVRTQHQARHNETVGIAERFSEQFSGSPGPRFPLDPEIVPADRCNCRCAMTFE
jgi:hypothetical protein